VADLGDDGRVRVSGSLVIAASELSWRFTRSGGPGGQHANTSDTRAVVTFDIAGSPSLGPRQRERLMEKLGPEVSASADDERSQARNRDLALRRLTERMAAALHRDPPRQATKPSKGAKQRRLESKRKRSQTKAQRRKPDW
jgi:ribosome-associated protein